VQIDTEMAEKYAKLAEKYAELRKAAKFRIIYDIRERNPVPFRHPDYDPNLAQELISSSMS